MKKISVVITFYNTFNYLEDAIRLPLLDKRVKEIIILDDCSTLTEYNLLNERIKQLLTGRKISFDINYSFLNKEKFNYKAGLFYMTKRDASKEGKKISIYRNKKNLGAFKSKYYAIQKAKCNWVYLLDGDNFLIDSSLNAIFNLKNWNKKTCYCPNVLITNKFQDTWDQWNFRRFQNYTLNLKKIQQLYKLDDFLENKFKCGIGLNGLLNIGNFFINRKQYLESLKKIIKKNIQPESADVIAFMYYWLIKNNNLKIVPDLYYFHRQRNGSYWHKTNKIGLIKKIKFKFEKIFKHINKEKYFNIVGSTPKYDNFNKTVYYEALIRNAQNN